MLFGTVIILKSTSSTQKQVLFGTVIILKWNISKEKYDTKDFIKFLFHQRKMACIMARMRCYSVQFPIIHIDSLWTTSFFYCKVRSLRSLHFCPLWWYKRLPRVVFYPIALSVRRVPETNSGTVSFPYPNHYYPSQVYF